MNTAETPDFEALYNQSQAEIADLKFVVEELKLQVNQMRKMIFGSRHEKFVPSEVPAAASQQCVLEMEVEKVEACSITDVKEITYKKAKTSKETTISNHEGRMKLPSHLRREEILLSCDEVPEGFRPVSFELTEQLCFIPGELYVKVFKRPKYIGEKDGQTHFLIPELPAQPLHKCIAGPSLLAHIAISKFVDHLPIYRQLQIFERHGVKLPSSTVGDWANKTCVLLEPLYELLKEDILASGYLGGDETPIKVMDRDVKKKTHRGWLWVYRDHAGKKVFFDYQPTRGPSGPRSILQEYKGYLQTDGYQIYEELASGNQGIILLCCMAHARRYFIDAIDNDRTSAAYVLEQMQRLYAIEDFCREEGLSHHQRLVLRKEKAVPILEALGKWMKEQYAEVTPKSAIGKALAYSIQRWEKLSIYSTDGLLEIDNNLTENVIRPCCIGKKNWLFAGSQEAAYKMAIMFSLTGTCKLNSINPQTWLQDVLTRIAIAPTDQLKKLLPYNWKPTLAIAETNALKV